MGVLKFMPTFGAVFVANRNNLGVRKNNKLFI